jgi:hypothetical protein
MANARKKKNFIHLLEYEGAVVLSHAAKQEAIYKHFLQHTGTYMTRHCTLNFSELGWQPRNLDHLELPFTQDEIKEVIMLAPKESSRTRWFHRPVLLQLLANYEG